MALKEGQLEQQVGDVVHRRRLVQDILEEGIEYRSSGSDEWYFGPLTIRHSPKPDTLIVQTPDGDLEHVRIPPGEDALQIEEVEADIIDVWEWWTEEL